MSLRRLAVPALAGLVLAGALPAQAASLDDVKHRGELRVAADPSSGAPYYIPAGEGFTGFEAELACALGKRLGVKVTFVTTPWPRMLDEVRADHVDVAMNAIEIGPKPGVRFTRPYYTASQALLVGKADTRIYGVKDLSGHKVGTTAGSVAANVLAHLPKPAIVKPYSNTEAPFKALAAGQVEAVLLESAMVRWHAKQQPAKFRLAGLPILPRPYGIAVREADLTLLEALNAALVDMRAKGELKQVLTTYGLWDSVQEPATVKPSPAPSAAPSAAPQHRRRHRRHH
jgi:ABC-type amino acid transport substrate-binding protein